MHVHVHNDDLHVWNTCAAASSGTLYMYMMYLMSCCALTGASWSIPEQVHAYLGLLHDLCSGDSPLLAWDPDLLVDAAVQAWQLVCPMFGSVHSHSLEACRHILSEEGSEQVRAITTSLILFQSIPMGTPSFSGREGGGGGGGGSE